MGVPHSINFRIVFISSTFVSVFYHRYSSLAFSIDSSSGMTHLVCIKAKKLITLHLSTMKGCHQRLRHNKIEHGSLINTPTLSTIRLAPIIDRFSEASILKRSRIISMVSVHHRGRMVRQLIKLEERSSYQDSCSCAYCTLTYRGIHHERVPSTTMT